MSDEPEKLVTISYRKDGKTYLMAMPSDHAEWAEEMLNLDREAVERAAAEKALTEAANELSLLDDGGKRGLAGNSKSSASAITHRHAVAVIRARAAEIRERGKL
jgi:phage terminase large subunit-like protein